MAYSVYSFVSQYADTGQIGIYVGTREDNLAEALAIAGRADRRHRRRRPARRASSSAPRRTSRAALLLSMESTSTHMNRLGKSLITDSEILSLERLVAEIDAVEPEAVAELAGELLAPERLSAAGIGPSEERFLEALEQASRRRSRARREDPAQRLVAAVARDRQGRGRRSGRPRRRPATTLVATEADADAMVDFTTPGRRRAEHPPRARRRRAVRRRHERLGHERGRRARRARRASPSSSRRTSRSAPC